MADIERFEIARLFSHDPSLLQLIPKSELRKRRDYWRLVRKAQGLDTDSNKPYTIEKIGVEIEADAKIIEDGA